MPVLLTPKHPDPETWSGLDWPRVRPDAPTRVCDVVLRLGLVNNMADAALEATERQFLTLLDAAAGHRLVQLTLYALPEVQRTPDGQRRVDKFYFGIDQLWEGSPERFPDGMIVTGREPRTSDLRAEAYWPSFTRLLEWTRTHARSAVWSCLAAHAAVLAMDGVERVRSEQKHFGIFTCERAARHALLAGAPERLRIPHSRWNGLPAGPLAAKGYRLLTHAGAGDVDTFIKQDSGLFLFFQGHPEYDSETLLREYRRDVGRYLNGAMETYPSPPRDYFDEGTERALREIEAQARVSRQETLLNGLSAVLDQVRIHNSWRDTGAFIYRNWLKHLVRRKRILAGAKHDLRKTNQPLATC